MQKKFLVTALAAFIPSTLVADVFLNGVQIEDFSVDYTDLGNIRIVTTPMSSSSSSSSGGDGSSSSGTGTSSSGSDEPDPTPEPEPEPEPEPNPVDGCGELPSDYSAAAPIDWANPGSQTRVALPRYSDGGMKGSKFTTTSGRQYEGQISVTAVTGTSGITRRVWFSECPGGPPMERGNCESFGTSSATLRWKQVEPGIPWESNRCNLKTNRTYYLNYRNMNCESSRGCDIYRNIYTNGRD